VRRASITVYLPIQTYNEEIKPFVLIAYSDPYNERDMGVNFEWDAKLIRPDEEFIVG
jgi:hypothetical protein